MAIVSINILTLKCAILISFKYLKFLKKLFLQKDLLPKKEKLPQLQVPVTKPSGSRTGSSGFENNLLFLVIFITLNVKILIS